jgi:hypothetical protein
MSAGNFDIEHWPNYLGKHALKRLVIGYIKGVLLLAGITLVLMTLYFFTHLFLFYWLSVGFLFGLAITPLLPIISYLQRNKKVPSYGINKEGFLVNERGWNACFFKWDEIKEIKEFEHPSFGKELHFEFVSYTKALNKPGQDKFAQSLAREYSIEKQPKKISNQLVKGDITNFIEAFIVHFSNYQNELSKAQTGNN